MTEGSPPEPLRVQKPRLDRRCLIAGWVSGISSSRRPSFTLEEPCHVAESVRFRVVPAGRDCVLGMQPGCRAAPNGTPDPPKTSSTASQAQDTAASPDAAPADDEAANVKANLAKLGEADRKLAEKQKVCP